MVKIIKEDLLLSTGFRWVSRHSLSLDKDDYIIEIFPTEIPYKKRNWECRVYSLSTIDFLDTIGKAKIQSVSQFNKFMDLMGVDFRLKV